MQCAGYVQRRDELRQELQYFMSRLRKEVVLPALKEHRQQLEDELLQPALEELRQKVHEDLVVELDRHRQHETSAYRRIGAQVHQDLVRELNPQRKTEAAAAASRVVASGGSAASAAGAAIPESQPLAVHSHWAADMDEGADRPALSRPHRYRGTIDEFASKKIRDIRKGSLDTGEALLSVTEPDDVDEEDMTNMKINQVARNKRGRRYSTGAEQYSLKDLRADGCNFRSFAQYVASHDIFDWLVSGMIMVNAAVVGLETDFMARYPDADYEIRFRTTDLIFLLFFSGELAIRFIAHGWGMFHNSGWGWTVFDIVVVLLQLLDVLLEFVDSLVPFTNVSFLRVMRIFRLLRISRLIRVLHLIAELRTMLSSILGSMKALFWVIVLYFLLVFAAGTFFTQAVVELRIDDGHEHAELRELKGMGGRGPGTLGMNPSQQLDLYYGSLGTTILCLWECISGGMDWKSMMDPLLYGVSPIVAVVFLMYVVFATIAMMNVVTGIFVEHAMRHAEEDQDIYVAKNVVGFFRQHVLGTSGEITMRDWEQQMDSPEMQALFRAVNVDPSDALSLFRLIDLNDSGTLEPDELIDGWIRLRGQAKSLDLALLMRETDRANQQIQKSLQSIEDVLAWMGPTVASMMRPETATVAPPQQQEPLPPEEPSEPSAPEVTGDVSARGPRVPGQEVAFAEPPAQHGEDSHVPVRSKMRPLRRSVVYGGEL